MHSTSGRIRARLVSTTASDCPITLPVDERELIALLREPSCYPHAPRDVEIVQTHISIVSLCGDLVYKLKKPLRLPFLDFSTLAKRRATCRDEVRLNRRLCPDVYLGTAALRAGSDGAGAGARFAATGDDDGAGDLDVAVVMRRLPAERMLDRLLAEGACTEAEIRALARRVAQFHRGADRGAATRSHGSPDRLRQLAADNFAEVAAIADHGMHAPLLAAMRTRTERDFAAVLPRLRARVAAGHVVDGHGDLHARNICMTAPPAVYDCIEFNAAFRCGDVATELAFLCMDLTYRGARPLAAVFVDEYVGATGDRELPPLLPPLLRYRAMVRAKVGALAAAEQELPAADRDGARRSAARHLQLAASTAVEDDGPSWLVLCGPPGSGKSTFARALSRGVDWPILATDVVRKQLAGLAPTARAAPEHYTAAFSARTYAEVQARATAATRGGAPVVLLDGNFPTTRHRAEAAAAARGAGARALVLHLDVGEGTGRDRLRRRLDDPARISDAGPDQHDALRRRFEAPTPGAAGEPPSLELDGELDVDALCARALVWLVSETTG